MLEKQNLWRIKWMVDSSSKLLEHKGLTQFEKLYLNLCLFRWLSPTRSLVKTFHPTGLYMLKYELGTGRPVFKRKFLKDNRLLALRTCRSNFFHSEKRSEKNEVRCEASLIQRSILKMISLKNIFWQIKWQARCLSLKKFT